MATALGQGFLPYSPEVFSRCLRLITMTLEADRLHRTDPEVHDRPNKDFIIVALDMLDGMASGLRASIESLVQASQPPLLELVCACAVDPVNEVRQSAFALLGDLSQSCFPYVEPYLDSLFPAIYANINPDHANSCNNAVWSLGEIALQYGTILFCFYFVWIRLFVGLLWKLTAMLCDRNAHVGSLDAIL